MVCPVSLMIRTWRSSAWAAVRLTKLAAPMAATNRAERARTELMDIFPDPQRRVRLRRDPFPFRRTPWLRTEATPVFASGNNKKQAARTRLDALIDVKAALAA